MGHSWSDPRSRDSAPERRAATLPSPTARRIWRCSHLQLWDIGIGLGDLVCICMRRVGSDCVEGTYDRVRCVRW